MSYDVVACLACGFCFAQNIPCDEDYRTYYATLSKYDSAPGISEVDRNRVSNALNFLTECGIKKNAVIADIGCGSGAWLATLRNDGYENLIGFDPAPHARTQAKTLFCLDSVYCAIYKDVLDYFSANHVDLVCWMAVLEHLPNLKSDLTEMVKILAPGSHILVEVPALELFEASEGEPFGEFSLEHIQYFSEASLTNLFRGLGARIVKSAIYPIDGLYSGSLFVLAEVGGYLITDLFVSQTSDVSTLEQYIFGSALRWHGVIDSIPTEPFLLYGAGSHSSRLIAGLDDDRKESVIAIVDANRNLHGKKLGGYTIFAPSAMNDFRRLPIVISSYRSRFTIAAQLSDHFENPLLMLY